MNTNEKLLKIFDRKNFRYGDIVKWEGEEFFVYKQIAENILNCEGNSILTEMKNVTLIQPAVGLSDVLVKFQEVRKFHTTLYITNKGYLTYEESTTKVVKQVDWDLAKNLWYQSDETKKFIAEILTKE